MAVPPHFGTPLPSPRGPKGDPPKAISTTTCARNCTWLDPSSGSSSSRPSPGGCTSRGPDPA
eukprot:5328715-Pyramimonas_sp.AAC.1